MSAWNDHGPLLHWHIAPLFAVLIRMMWQTAGISLPRNKVEAQKCILLPVLTFWFVWDGKPGVEQHNKATLCAEHWNTSCMKGTTSARTERHEVRTALLLLRRQHRNKIRHHVGNSRSPMMHTMRNVRP